MTTKHIGCSNPRNFKEKIELLKMKEAASTANFAAAMRDAQEICQIAYAYDALPLSLDHSHLHGNAMDRSVLMKAHSLSDITDTGRQMASKHSDLPIQDNILRSKVIPVDRKRVCGGSTISSSHSGIYPIGSTVSNTSDERVNERVPTGVQTKEHISIKKEEEQEVTTSQTPNICPFSYNSIGSSTDSSFGYKRNTYGGHDSDYNNNNTSTNCSYASSWSTTGPFHHQHSTQKSCIENWSNECSGGGVVGSHQQIPKNFSPYNINNNNNDIKPHYQGGVHQKPHLPANPYLFSASHSDAEVAATSLNTQQSLANSSSQYTCESGYFSVGDSIGTPVGFRSFPPTNNLQHSKVPFSVNFTEQLGRTPTPYSVVDWRRTASDSSIHNTLSGIQLNPTDQYTYGGKAEKSHMFSPRPVLSSDHHYFRPACKLRGVEEENANTPLAPPMLDDTDTKRGCVFRRQRDAHLLDNNNTNSNRFVHTEMLTNEPHVVPAKRPYTCSTDPHSNGFEAAASQMKICSPRLDNLAGGGGGGLEQKNMDPTDASLKHKSWKMRSGVVYNPHNNNNLDQSSSLIRPTYQCLSSSAIPSDSKYAVEELTDPSRNCLSQENHHSFSNLHNYSSSLSSSSQQAASASADILCRNNTINSNSSNMMMMTSGRSVPRMASAVTTTPTTSLTINNGRGEITSMNGAGGGSSAVIRDSVVTDDLFLRSTNDLDEYLQLPSLICKADESNNSFAARRDSCTMTAEILSTLSNVREEVSENSLSRRIPTEHNNDTQQQQRSSIYVSNAANSIPINTNITNNQRSDHLMRNLISTDPLSNNNNNSYAYNNRCGSRSQQQSLHSHFIQSLHGGDAHADADSITTMTTPTTAGTTLATITNSTLTPTTIYSSCLHHVGDKIGISMSPNDYRLLTDPRLANYVTDKETEAQLID
ncbi:unnamed protein product [Trichobilharzia szidati]|nr:unnamed protein product [Trichobilharzia szidati]